MANKHEINNLSCRVFASCYFHCFETANTTFAAAVIMQYCWQITNLISNHERNIYTMKIFLSWGKLLRNIYYKTYGLLFRSSQIFVFSFLVDNYQNISCQVCWFFLKNMNLAWSFLKYHCKTADILVSW